MVAPKNWLQGHVLPSINEMTALPEYPYSLGNRVEDRNTYFYTPFLGNPFLEAWKLSRIEAIASHEPAISAPSPESCNPNDNSGKAILERIYAEALDLPDRRADSLLLLLKRFEVVKRIFTDYNDELRPIDPKQFHDTSLYLRFAEVLDLAYSQTKSLFYLNAYLKSLDVLVSLRDEIAEDHKARFARCVRNEIQHVEEISRGNVLDHE